MKITLRQNYVDPSWPIMHGDTPAAKEFNRREEEIWKNGSLGVYNFEQIATVILEILIDDYNERHQNKKKKKND